MKNRNYWESQQYYYRTSFSVIPERVSMTTALNGYENGSYANSYTKFEVVDGYGDSWLITEDRLHAERLKDMLNSLTKIAKRFESDLAWMRVQREDAVRKAKEADQFKDVGIALIKVMQFINDYKAKEKESE